MLIEWPCYIVLFEVSRHALSGTRNAIISSLGASLSWFLDFFLLLAVHKWKVVLIEMQAKLLRKSSCDGSTIHFFRDAILGPGADA